MIYAGLDLHKSFSLITATNTKGEEVIKQRNLPNNGEIVEFFQGLSEPVEASPLRIGG